MKVYIENRQRQIRINQQKIKRDSAALLRNLGLENAELSILLVNDSLMRKLNHKFRGLDKTTDVLSFPQISKKSEAGSRKLNKNNLSFTSHLLLGDVVINLQAAKRQSPEHQMSFTDEMRWLLIHGILHLIGYDHEKSKYAEGKMRQKEKELLEYISGKEMN